VEDEIDLGKGDKALSEYKDFGWSEAVPPSHSYLYPTLLSLLDKRKNRKILDIGCGNGAMACRLIDAGFDVYGIDASSEGIAIARRKYMDRFYIQDVTSKTLPDEIKHIQFDTIISTEVIEHLYDPRGYLQFCKDILSRNPYGGELIISTPYHGYIKNVVLALTGKLDEHFTVLRDGGHIKFFSEKTLTTLLEEFGFQKIQFRGSGRIPWLWKSMFIKARLSTS
jgi:2-polyprenyl-3-methyl-5-hydroxy-6-metoxy-1,4-benzoquinol methylase